MQMLSSIVGLQTFKSKIKSERSSKDHIHLRQQHYYSLQENSDFWRAFQVKNRARESEQMISFVMWKSLCLSVWYLSPHKHGWASESPTTKLPPSNSLCLYCMIPEYHILSRETQSTAMPPWTGKSVTQSELFVDDYAAWQKYYNRCFHWKLSCGKGWGI